MDVRDPVDCSLESNSRAAVVMSPYYGDHINKEREALNHIIRMKRKPKAGVGELMFFVVMPLLSRSSSFVRDPFSILARPVTGAGIRADARKRKAGTVLPTRFPV